MSVSEADIRKSWEHGLSNYKTNEKEIFNVSIDWSFYFTPRRQSSAKLQRDLNLRLYATPGVLA
jgi:hypothetical protein